MSSDDIEERLRHVAWLAEEGSAVVALATTTAADEIVRLRAEVESLTTEITNLWIPSAEKWMEDFDRLRAAGDALYELVSVRLIIPADQHDDAVEQIRKWKEASRG